MWTKKCDEISNLDIFLIVSSLKKPIKPNTSNKLAILEPTTLPTDKSGNSFKMASMETSNSGRDVPNPIITTPMKNSEILFFFPIDVALEIKMSAPFTTKKRPNIK